MAAVIALLAFAFNFIPNVGPIVATLTPVPIMLLSGQSSFGEMLLAVLLPGLIHFVVGHLVEPKVMGSSLELDPVVILLGLMLAELMWGPVGMLLAMPLMVVARILLDQTAEIARVRLFAYRDDGQRGTIPVHIRPAIIVRIVLKHDDNSS